MLPFQKHQGILCCHVLNEKMMTPKAFPLHQLLRDGVRDAPMSSGCSKFCLPWSTVPLGSTLHTYISSSGVRSKFSMANGAYQNSFNPTSSLNKAYSGHGEGRSESRNLPKARGFGTQTGRGEASHWAMHMWHSSQKSSWKWSFLQLIFHYQFGNW